MFKCVKTSHLISCGWWIIIRWR